MPVEIKNVSRITIIRIVYIGLVIGIILPLLFWRCKYGYVYTDEATYLLMPYRFILGDKLIIDEWHPTQLSALPVIPMLYAFIKVFDGTTGVYLFFRYFYTLLKVLVSIYAYTKLRKYDEIGAMISSVLFLLFASDNLMAISYNSISRGCLLLSLLLIDNNENVFGRKEAISSYVAGVFLSLSVLGMPFFALLFIIYIGSLISRNLRNDKVLVKRRMWITSGVATSVVIFSAYLFRKVNVSELIKFAPNILALPDHPRQTVFAVIRHYVTAILTFHTKNAMVFFMYMLFIVLITVIFVAKHKNLIDEKKVVVFYVCDLCVGTLLQLVYLFGIEEGLVSYYLFAPTVVAIVPIIICNDEKIRRVFKNYWIPGVLATFFQSFGSNTGFTAISAVASISTTGSIIILLIFCKECIKGCTKLGRRIVTLSLGLFISITVLSVGAYRLVDTYWDKDVYELDTEIKKGPMKGIVTTSENSQIYANELKDTETIKENLKSDDRLLLLSNPATYLAGNNLPATYTGFYPTYDVLEKYWIETDNVPSEIYISEYYEQQDLNIWESFLEFECKKIEHGNMLYNIKLK